MTKETTGAEPTIAELRAKYPYIPAYTAYMLSYEYWTNDQLREAHQIAAPHDTYMVHDGKFFTLKNITNQQLLAFLKSHAADQLTINYITGQLAKLTISEYKRKVVFYHEDTKTNWLSLDEVTVPVIIDWLKKEYLTQGKPSPGVVKLSKEFSTLIRDKYFTTDELNAVNEENARNNDSSCATHDYCDANMIMDEAFQTVMGREFVFQDDEVPGSEEKNAYDTDLINAAWSMSKAAGFGNTE